MSLLSLIKENYIKYFSRKDHRFIVPRKVQEKILDKFPNPKNNIERSFFQYKCQVKFLGWEKLILHLGSIFIIFYQFINFYTKKLSTDNCNEYELVCMLSGVTKDRIPLSLIKNYESNYFYNKGFKNYLNKKDIKWILNIIKKYPLSWFFHAKIINKVSQYSYIINKFRPEAIAVHAEYSATSSLLTEYCHEYDVKHINFMHGEKIYYIRDSFFKYDKCYVWDEHYKDLFISLRADPEQFIIEKPPIFKYKIKKSVEVKFDYCYYLAGESNTQLKRIFNNLGKLKKQGYKVLVRGHPRWTNFKYVNKIAEKKKISIEEKGVDIIDSLLASKKIISLFSTVLYQAYLLDKQIVIDDISNIEKFNKLKNLDYICLNKNHSLLSDEL